MASLNPKRGHHVINNDVLNIYGDIIKKFVMTFGVSYFQSNNYSDLVAKNIINKDGLPVDCVLRTAPLQDETKRKIEESTVHFLKEFDDNAVKFGQAKKNLLHHVTSSMRDICCSLKERKLMPKKLEKNLDQLSTSIKSFNRDVFVDKIAREEWLKEEDNDDTSLENWIHQVEVMIANIADKDTIQLVVHWGQWAFRVSEGLDHGRL